MTFRGIAIILTLFVILPSKNWSQLSRSDSCVTMAQMEAELDWGIHLLQSYDSVTAIPQEDHHRLEHLDRVVRWQILVDSSHGRFELDSTHLDSLPEEIKAVLIEINTPVFEDTIRPPATIVQKSAQFTNLRSHYHDEKTKTYIWTHGHGGTIYIKEYQLQLGTPYHYEKDEVRFCPWIDQDTEQD